MTLEERQDQKRRDEYTSALVELTKELEEFRSAGSDPLKLVGAIQRFVDAKIAQGLMIMMREI